MFFPSVKEVGLMIGRLSSHRNYRVEFGCVREDQGPLTAVVQPGDGRFELAFDEGQGQFFNVG
jgi:hypothetical protein